MENLEFCLNEKKEELATLQLLIGESKELASSKQSELADLQQDLEHKDQLLDSIQNINDALE